MTDDRTAALKARVCDAIDARADEIIAFAKDVQAEPELGYKEVKTTEKVVSLFEDLDLDVETELAITGARARAGSGDFVAAVLGELDALVNPDHPMADPETGAVHACGHNAQLAHLVGTAFGLVGSGVVSDLDGAVEFVAVPAEEYLDLDYRRGLLEAGDIEFFGGKQELIRRGYVDDWDAAAMMHAGSDTPERTITSNFSTNGFVGKFVTYRGTEAHAGAAPEEGVNALNAAMLGMNAVHAQRERFRDEDHVRVHPIITRGGDGVNVVPAEVTMESYVRAASVEAVADANESVNRALAAGAMGVGGDVEIEDYPGYMPLRTDETIVAFYDENARDIVGPDAVTAGTPHLSGSTDMGDITQLVPGIHPWTGGFEGAVHARDFRVVDEEMAYVIPAKLTACTLVDLLTSPEAMAAVREAKAEKRGREEYLDAVRSLRTTTTESYRD
ncbi:MULTISPECIES: amidohydrolase [Haloferax]|uniref:Peptidase M20 domain-containing protein 2 n=1 Tax=Haloferax massiliensis TaxID=1476858 RepID=A0A0D6JSF9_9EURY|nr:MULTISPECIES: amidohydrolase [Haloferax]MDS0242184.1 amidohydrolase [Haloferax sp. S2CR25]MDS0445305.1 amidohydrolase [Haloferax sp. S2CR25-2]CQR50831.1 putative hydrolase YxeP [Haloferax massiliensis]